MSDARTASVSRRLSMGLTLALALSLVLVVVIIAVVAPRLEEASLRDETAKSAERLAQMLESAVWDLDMDRAEQLADAFAADRRVVSITIHEALGQAGRTVQRSPSSDTVLVRHDIVHDGARVGDVTLAFDRGSYRAQIARDLEVAVAASLIALIASLVGVRVMLRTLLERPLEELSAQVERYAAGDFSAEAREVGYGELRAFSARLANEVTVRRRTEAALRLESAALQAAANAIVIADRDGKVESVNPAFTALTGYERSECVGRTLGALVNSGRHDVAFFERMWRTILAGEAWSGEIENARKDGTVFTADLTITPVKDEFGEVIHFISVQQDISQRKLLEEQFRQAQKLESIGRLAGGVAHDFNNMLGVIIGHTELAMLRVDPSQPLHNDLAEIQDAATRSADLTRQLLAFARKQDIEPKVVDVGEAVSDSLKMLRRLIGTHIELVWQPGGSVWPVRIDPSQLDQVLTNLCVNARDAISGAGTLTLSTQNVSLDAHACAGRPGASPGDYVLLRVSDTGRGMSDEVLSHIFEPFFTTKGVGEGTGLGLATIYGVVAQNGGWVEASSAVGRGTTFEIYLPRYVGRAVHQKDARANSLGTVGRETILLVEDEPMLLTLTKRALQELGYRVIPAASPDAALRIAKSRDTPIHLLLTDIVMPGMNGRELAKLVRAELPRTAQLFMSGYSAGTLHGVEASDDDPDFLAKPFTITSLATKVRRALESTRV